MNNMTMYVQTRTGGWATHRETPTGKTRTGIPLYTLAEARAKGYKPPKKAPPPPRIEGGRDIHVAIDEYPVANGDMIYIGKATFDDGSEDRVGFSKAPSTALKTYRKEGSSKYLAVRMSRNDKGKWVRISYRKGVGISSPPLTRYDGKEGYHTPQELADHDREVRGGFMEEHMGLFQDLLIAMSPGLVTIELHGKKRQVYAAPKAAPWMQSWLNRRIESSQRQPELYRFFQEWKANRFRGDDKAFTELQTWALKDAHIVKIEESHRKRWSNRRNDQYKKLAYRLVMQAKNGGSIKVTRPELKESGVKADKPDLMTEDRASNQRKFILSAAASTFVMFLKLCAAREGVRFAEEENLAPKNSKQKRERSGGK